MRYPTLSQVLEIHRRIILQSGGALGILSLGALESALAQPRLTYNDEELYPTLPDKAAALGYALINDHPFIDGNKRTGHAAIEIYLLLNGFEIQAPIEEQEQAILNLASGKLSREAFVDWLKEHIVEKF